MANKIRQHPELVAVARQLLARVGDQALTFHQPRVVEQYRSDYRELVRRSSGVHPDLGLEVERARPIFELIIILEIYLAEPIGVGSAFLEFGEIRERDRRRPATGPTGIVDERVRDIRSLLTDVDVPEIEPCRPVLGPELLDRNQPDQGEEEPSGQARHWLHYSPVERSEPTGR